MKLEDKHKLAIETPDFCKTLAQETIDKIKKDTSTGSCWHIDEVANYTLEQAKQLDSLHIEEKQNMPLFGLTVGMKDLFCIQGLTTTAGSKILSNFVSPYSSHLWTTLHSKGALLGAKLAMDEFAMGSFSDTSYLGKVSIPGFPEHTAGGSSGGSGSALAADLVDFTTGSDTGGSVRLPASFCSVVGYKPSYGAFSRHGMIAYASSLDQAGLLTKSLTDLQYLLKADLAQKDKKDMTCKGLGTYCLSTIKKPVKIGYFEQFLTDDSISLDVKKAYKKTLEKLTKANIELVPVHIKYMKEAAQIYYVVACSEASSNLARYQGVFFGKKLIDKPRDGSYWEQVAQYRSENFGLEVQKRIMLGSYILSSENFDAMYKKAVALRHMLVQEFEQVFQDVDQLVLPVSPMTAPTWDKISTMTSAQIYMSDYMTVPFSLAGLPALSLPWFKNKQGLGIGMQFVGKKMSDYELVEQLLEIEKICNITNEVIECLD
jgi:aspartyl-tRNA(Asn)/glutamyl-tRNA(Gln) amidotransferase subunit A